MYVWLSGRELFGDRPHDNEIDEGTPEPSLSTSLCVAGSRYEVVKGGPKPLRVREAC